MSDTAAQEALLHADLILRVNAPLSGYDRRKLNALLLSDLTAARTDAGQKYSAANFAAGDQAGASRRVFEAREKIGGLIRNAQSAILALPEEDVPEADRIDALVTLGFVGGNVGNLRDGAHLAALAADILAGNPGLPTIVRVPAGIITRLSNWVGILNANQGLADGDSREEVTAQKDVTRELLIARIGRVRLYIASTSDIGEREPGLAAYGFQPQRMPGDAQPQPRPEAPGTATLDAAARTLTIPALPLHATSIVGWRQAPGGDPEPAGISDGTTVGFSETSPLVPGVTYTVWVTGRNSIGDGPPSNVQTLVG